MFPQTNQYLMQKSRTFHNSERAIDAYATPNAFIGDSVCKKGNPHEKINTDFLSSFTYFVGYFDRLFAITSLCRDESR